MEVEAEVERGVKWVVLLVGDANDTAVDEEREEEEREEEEREEETGVTFLG